MRKNFSVILFLASLFLLSAQAFAQYPTRIDERVQQTVSRHNRVDLAQWLRIPQRDIYSTEVLNLFFEGESYSNNGVIEILADGFIVGRMQFGRYPTRASFRLPLNVTLDRVRLRIDGEVFVDNISAIIYDRRYTPRPFPPRYEPSPRPYPPHYEPAPRPIPPRYEPAPRPTPPRYEPAPPPGRGHGPGRGNGPRR